MSERNPQTCTDLETTKSRGHLRPSGCKSLLLSPVAGVILNSNINGTTQNATQALVLVFMQTSEYIYYITLTFSSHGVMNSLDAFSFCFLNSLLPSPLLNYSYQDGAGLCVACYLILYHFFGKLMVKDIFINPISMSAKTGIRLPC